MRPWFFFKTSKTRPNLYNAEIMPKLSSLIRYRKYKMPSDIHIHSLCPWDVSVASCAHCQALFCDYVNNELDPGTPVFEGITYLSKSLSLTLGFWLKMPT